MIEWGKNDSNTCGTIFHYIRGHKREMERCHGKKDYEMTLLIQRRDESILNGRGGACRDRVSVVERDRVEH